MANAAAKVVAIPTDFASQHYDIRKLREHVMALGGRGNIGRDDAVAGINALCVNELPKNNKFWRQKKKRDQIPNPLPTVDILPANAMSGSKVEFSLTANSTIEEMRAFASQAGLHVDTKVRKDKLWIDIVLQWHQRHPGLDDSGNASFEEEGAQLPDEMLSELEKGHLPKLGSADAMLKKVHPSTRYADDSRMEAPAPRRPEHIRERVVLTSEALLCAVTDYTPRIGLKTIDLVGTKKAIDNVFIALRAWPMGISDAEEDERGKRLTKSVLPVFVPSMGRAGDLPLLFQCNEEAKHEVAQLPVVVAVGPSDLDDYAATYPHLVFALLPWDVGGIGYSREVLRSLAAGLFTLSNGVAFDGAGSPVHMLDDNILFKINKPLVVGQFSQSTKDLLLAGLECPLFYAQRVAHKAGMHKANTDCALVSFEEIGSSGGSTTTSVFGKVETLSCYKAVLMHAPLAESRNVRYIAGLRWPEDIAFNYALAKSGFRLLKARWPYRFEKMGGGGGQKEPRFTVASLLAPWRDVKSLSSGDKDVLAAILKRIFMQRDKQLSGGDRSVALTFALFELDWRQATVAEGLLSVNDVAAGPVSKLIVGLKDKENAGPGRWSLFLSTLTEAATAKPGLGDPTFVAECLLSRSETDKLGQGLASEFAHSQKDVTTIKQELLNFCEKKLSYKRTAPHT